MDQVNTDGLKRAKWVDCGKSNPKKHGEFEGHFKGEPSRIRRYKWTGRQWLYLKPGIGRKKARWVPSMFGVPGDKWRGLAEDPSLQPIANFDPEKEIKGAIAEQIAENTDAAVMSATKPLGDLFKEEEAAALQRTKDEQAVADTKNGVAIAS